MNWSQIGPKILEAKDLQAGGKYIEKRPYLRNRNRLSNIRRKMGCEDKSGVFSQRQAPHQAIQRKDKSRGRKETRINNEPPHSGEEAYYKELLNFRISHAKISTRYRKYRLPPAIFASATTFLTGVRIGCCIWSPKRRTAARFCGAIPTFSPAAVCWAPMAQMQQVNRRFGCLTAPPNKQFAKSGAIIRRRCIACMMKTLCLYNPQACGSLPLQAPSFLV